MSAAVAAIAKKLAVMLATDKRTWKLIGAIAGGLLFIALWIYTKEVDKYDIIRSMKKKISRRKKKCQTRKQIRSTQKNLKRP
ncbi:MAG: hypothetical protein QM689_03220 [Oscillospiraceae bacterium]